jgi:hypothetical protein
VRTPVLTTLLLSTFLLCSSPALAGTKDGPTGPAPEIALVGGTILDVSNHGQSSGDIQDAVVVLRGGEIVAAGPRKSVEIPAGARRIDVSGKYIVPGLTDSFGALGKQSHANAYLYMGVTSIVGVEGQPRRPDLYLKAHPSPRIYPLGIVGYAEKGDEVVQSTEAETLKAIEEAAQHGVKVLLIHYPITPERTVQIVEKAHELGLGTIGELGFTTYEEAIQAGVDAFVHTSRYSIAIAPPELRQAMAKTPFGRPSFDFANLVIGLSPDDPKLNQYAALLAASPVALMPTLSMLYLDLPDHRNPWLEPAAKIVDPKDIWLPANPLTGRRDEAPEMTARTARAAEAWLKVEERYRRAGAKYLTGSGTTAFGTIPGVSLHTELELLTRLGLPPRQALAAATSNFGETFHWKTVGQVKAGYNADLLVLNANPLQNIENLKNIQNVILNGEILDREKLLAEPH